MKDLSWKEGISISLITLMVLAVGEAAKPVCVPVWVPFIVAGFAYVMMFWGADERRKATEAKEDQVRGEETAYAGQIELAKPLAILRQQTKDQASRP